MQISFPQCMTVRTETASVNSGFGHKVCPQHSVRFRNSLVNGYPLDICAADHRRDVFHFQLFAES